MDDHLNSQYQFRVYSQMYEYIQRLTPGKNYFNAQKLHNGTLKMNP